MRTHAHAVRLASMDVPPARAAALLHDALLGGLPERLRLERLAGVSTYKRSESPDLLGIYRKVAAGAYWAGETFVVPGVVPDSVTCLMAGMRLGDVVYGSGWDDAIVTSVSTYRTPASAPEDLNPARTDIRVESGTVGPEDLGLTPMQLHLTPMRRLAANLHYHWYGQSQVRFDMPIREPFPDQLMMVAFLAVLIIIFPFLYILFRIESLIPDRASKAWRRPRGRR